MQQTVIPRIIIQHATRNYSKQSKIDDMMMMEPKATFMINLKPKLGHNAKRKVNNRTGITCV
uniref:Uncharacterized protein n=1 Tax=Cucumis melo TaxID=3656 RepID=A0A9I9E5V3_CUCME